MLDATSPQWRSLSDALHQLYVACDAEQFPHQLLHSLGPLIASEVVCSTELGPDQRMMNFADRPDDRLEAMMPILAELHLQHPRIRDFVDNGQVRALAVSDYLSRREWHRREVYRHFYGAMGIEDQLGIMMPISEHGWAGLVFNRTSRTFTQGEHQLLDLLRPHVCQAWANAQLLDRLKRQAGVPGSEPTHDARSVVRLCPDGRVDYCPDSALRLLRRFWPEAGAASTPLPTPVAAWVGEQLRLSARGEAVALRRVASAARPFGALTMRLIEEAEGAGWLLALECAERRSARPEVAALAPRLQRLLQHLLRGRSEKEIAAALALSPHTAHEYVKQLYRRLQVKSRAELMAKFVSG